MITLTLLHPVQLTTVQHWTFEAESIVRIGRSTDNHVVLYSAVVSRYHVEVQQIDSAWHVVSLGANGTYLDGKRISQVPAQDGMIIRLARSGPNIQIHLEPSAGKNKPSATSLRQSRLPVSQGNASELGSTDHTVSLSSVLSVPDIKTSMEMSSLPGNLTCTHFEETLGLGVCSHCGAPLENVKPKIKM